MGTLSLYGQEKKIEITPFIGYTFSEGVNVQPVDPGNGVVINGLDPKSGLSYGFQFDFNLAENLSAGFLFSEQDSALLGKTGAADQEYTDMKLRNYHGVITYTMGEEDMGMRPYFFGGLGATNFSFGELEGSTISSETRFSTTWGAGVKVFPSENVGFRLGGRWTPTYIKSDASGIWCNPYWPWSCWVVSEADYANQFELSAGITFRF
jgi:opacity protein-like surface antigen